MGCYSNIWSNSQNSLFFVHPKNMVPYNTGYYRITMLFFFTMKQRRSSFQTWSIWTYKNTVFWKDTVAQRSLGRSLTPNFTDNGPAVVEDDWIFAYSMSKLNSTDPHYVLIKGNILITKLGTLWFCRGGFSKILLWTWWQPHFWMDSLSLNTYLKSTCKSDSWQFPLYDVINLGEIELGNIIDGGLANK